MSSIVQERAARLFDSVMAEGEPFQGLRSSPKPRKRRRKIKPVETATEIEHQVHTVHGQNRSEARESTKCNSGQVDGRPSGLDQDFSSKSVLAPAAADAAACTARVGGQLGDVQGTQLDAPAVAGKRCSLLRI